MNKIVFLETNHGHELNDYLFVAAMRQVVSNKCDLKLLEMPVKLD